MQRRAEFIIRKAYGDKNGNISPLNGKLMQEDLTALTVSHLSNFAITVLPNAKAPIKFIVMALIDLEAQEAE